MISFRAFRKVYGRQVAVHDLTLDVPRGSVVALLGPNGSGKTTTLKAAAGLTFPTSGAVLIGTDAAPASSPRARASLAFLPQRVAFPDALTGFEVLEFYRALRSVPAARTTEVLRFAELNGASRRAVGTYSGGMVQRLGLAVAMLPDVPVLLLDEPTAALDPDGLQAFYTLIEHHVRDGRTVLFTSHQLGDAERLASQFAVLVGGRLAAVMSHRDLHDRLAQRGMMRVRLAHVTAGLLPLVRAVAPDASLHDGELLVPGPPSLRPEVLELLARCAAEVRGLTTEEGRLDTLYRELVREGS